MKHNTFLEKLSVILVLIGGICWGLIGAFGFDLIGSIFNMDLSAWQPSTESYCGRSAALSVNRLQIALIDLS